MEARNRKVDEWLGRVRTGQVQLPRFQRFEAWGYGQVLSLLESLVNELPIGAVTTLEVGNEAPFQHREIAGAPEASERLAELLLDGQQRITALWRSLTGDYEDRSYYLSLREKTEYQGIAVQAVKRSFKDGKQYPLWADDPVECHNRGLVPVTLLMPGSGSESQLSQWCRSATADSADDMIDLFQEISTIRSRVAAYNLPFVSLPSGTTPAVVLEVFTKINTGSTPLSAFDIITANIEDEVGESLHDLLDSLKGAAPGFTRYGDVQDFVLRAAALMQDRTPDKPTILDLDWKRVVKEWANLVEGVKETVDFLEQERIFDASRLPIVTPLPALIALWAKASHLQADRLGAVRTAFRAYLWRSFFTDRYESSAHTQVIRDVRNFTKVLEDGDLQAGEIFSLSLPTKEDVLAAGWPKKRDRLSRAVLAVSLYGTALDLADGSQATAGNLAQREYHHLFPDGYLKREQPAAVPGLALNCALITWKTNRKISDKDPLTYLKERTEASSLGDEEIADRLRTHTIPVEPLVENRYDDFLSERADLVIRAMEALAKGQPWRP